MLTPHWLSWGSIIVGVHSSISHCLLPSRTGQAGWQSLKGAVSQGLRAGLNNEELLAVQRSLHVLGAAKLLLQELAGLTQARTQLQHEEACSDAISCSRMLLAQHAAGCAVAVHAWDPPQLQIPCLLGTGTYHGVSKQQ